MKRSILSLLVITIALMVPAVATASVLISDPIAVNVSDTAFNHVFISNGPGYNVASELGYIAVHGNNKDTSNVSVNLSSVPGMGFLELTNVLEINNTLSSGTQANVTLSIDMPAGTFLYYNSTLPSTIVHGSISGVNMSKTGNPATFQLVKGASPVYLSFLILGNSVGAGSITFSYSIS